MTPRFETEAPRGEQEGRDLDGFTMEVTKLIVGTSLPYLSSRIERLSRPQASACSRYPLRRRDEAVKTRVV